MTKIQSSKPNLTMNKYIQDTIRNNSRSVLSGLTRPQQKALSEVIRGLFTANTPIRHLAQHPEKSAKRQGDKISYHLNQINLKEKVESFSLNRIRNEIKKNSIHNFLPLFFFPLVL